MALIAIFTVSCKTPKDIAYMQGAEQLPENVLRAAAKHHTPVIQPGDLLYINVSATNAEVVAPFNKTEYISAKNSNQGNNENAPFYYLVDNDGYIDFPMLGRLKIGGMTQTAVQDQIASLIYPKYLTERPGVEVRFQNFHVSVMGEVNSPGVIKAANGRLNILEAIAQSGDLTIKGRRDNVMLIHTNADGSRQVTTVDLTDKNLLVSPNFNLRQNDIIYVEPNASQQRSSWTIPPGLTLGMSAVSTLISVATLVITIAK